MSDQVSQQQSGLAGQLPSDFHPVTFEGFEGLNTKAPRPSIGDNEMSWCDGWMPIAPDDLRILPGCGPEVTRFPAAIVWFGFGNISDQPFMSVALGDGSIVNVDPNTGIQTPVALIGTIQNPSSIMGFSQWGSQYLIFAKDQTNGYWLFDGTNLFAAGMVAPEATIINSGLNYTSPPLITLQTTGSGGGAAFLATIENGSVTRIVATLPGSGFAKDDLVVLNITGGGSDDQAFPDLPTITPTSGGLDEVYVITGGNGYTGRTYVDISGGDGSGASISLAIQSGTIVGAAVVQTGTGYTSAPTLTIIDPGVPLGGGSSIPGGSGGSIGCNIAFGQITGIGMINGGSGYTSAPIVHIYGDGTGATAVAEIQGGQVTSLQMKTNGRGYNRGIVMLEGGNFAANATMLIMPWGISGTAVEVYQQRVWVTNGGASATFPPKNRTIFSAPSSAWDFGDGGGAFQSKDSFLRVGYHWLKQTNGFLYLGGDSSLNYISGVSTTNPSGTTVSAIPITTFGDQNVDPQIGSPWPSSVQVFSRNIVFASSVGVFVSYGGAVTKASIPLDGFYGSGPIFAQTANFSSAVAHIFGVPVYMLLLPVMDKFTGETVNKLLMWDGKRWWTSQQDRNLTYITTQSFNSQLIAWGTDGNSIFRLFQEPSTAFTKVVQSKLKSDPTYLATKTAISLSGVVNANRSDNVLGISIDTEAGLGVGNAAVAVVPQGEGLVWVGIEWNIAWSGVGLDVFGPLPVGQQGRMMGFTVETSASDVELISLMAVGQVETVNA